MTVVAAFGRTRRSDLGGSAVSSSKRASASASRSPSNTLEARQEAVGSEDPEPEEMPLVAAAAGALDAEVRPAQEHGVGPDADDVVDAVGDALGNLEQASEPPPHGFDSGQRPDTLRPMVEVLDGGGVRPGVGIGVERPQHRRDRARGRRGAGALGALGEQLGVALVQPHDGVGEAVGGEELAPTEAPAFVGLDDADRLSLTGGDVEASPARRFGRPPAARQGERLAERREVFVSETRTAGSQHAMQRHEHALASDRGSGHVFHRVVVIREQARDGAGVPGRECCAQAFRSRRRGVRPDAALGPRRLGASARRSERAPRRRGRGRTPPRAPTRPSVPKHQEPDELPLEGAAADAIGAECRQAHQERVGSQSEDVVDAAGDVGGRPRAWTRARAGRHRLRARIRSPDGPVVDELDARARWPQRSTRSRATRAKAATERAVAAARVRSGPSGRSSA